MNTALTERVYASVDPAIELDNTLLAARDAANGGNFTKARDEVITALHFLERLELSEAVSTAHHLPDTGAQQNRRAS